MFQNTSAFHGIRVKRSDYNLQIPSGASKETSFEFGRFEYKYILPRALREEIEAAIQDFMIFDPFSAALPDHCYSVNSLYFDDANYSDYYEKTDGLLNRRKYRLRTYDNGDAPVFLEEKGRRNHFSYKYRCLVDQDFLNHAVAGNWRALLNSIDGSEDVPLSGFVTAGVRRDLGPKVRVIYRRRPYIADYGYRFRVTFDDQIEAHWTNSLHAPATLVRPVLPGKTVLEIKFEDSIPMWFTRLIGSYQLNMVSISKYCQSAEALDLVKNLE